MTVRSVVIALALAVIGAGGGYAASALDGDEPRTISMAMPVPAASPSYPVNEYDVQPDLDDPALAPGLPLVDARFRASAGYALLASVPEGWRKGGDGSMRTFAIAGANSNTYRLRIGIFTDRQAVGVKRAARIGALESAEDDGEMQNVVIEDEDDDRFVATYLQNGYRRVTMERFLDLGRTSAYATVAVVGREADRAGMADLLERVSASLRVP